MKTQRIHLQGPVFGVVVAAFANIYLTQPVLPVLVTEFGVNEATASLSISLVILGIAIANLPVGRLVDRYPIRPIILIGGAIEIAAALVCGFTDSFTWLAIARFVQGLALPALTTCLSAYLARRLPVDRLNVGMGAYVSATVVGGLGGRLLGGWIPLHWRYAFFGASILLALALFGALLGLPKDHAAPDHQTDAVGFRELLSRPELLRNYLVAFGAFWVFSASFNYLPFYLSGPPFFVSTQVITLVYLTYLAGAVMGPLAGRLSNRIGNGTTMALGAALFGAALVSTLIPSLLTLIICLAGVCAGFFTTHSAATGGLNRKLTTSRGRANALYVLFYYVGGYCGITATGLAYQHAGWPGVVILGLVVLLLPISTGLIDRRLTAQPQR